MQYIKIFDIYAATIESLSFCTEISNQYNDIVPIELKKIIRFFFEVMNNCTPILQAKIATNIELPRKYIELRPFY